MSYKKNTLEVFIPLPEPILRLNQVFQENGYTLYLVGGAVRDFLMGIEPKDYDVASGAPPYIVKQILTEALISNYPKGESFGVIVAHIDGQDYEIATFREDGGAFDGRRPDKVTWTTPEEDAKRRDLTINALFYEISKHIVIDFFNGQALEDVRNRIVRVVGDPMLRFEEDRLRILRLPRFHCRFSVKPIDLDARTLSAIKWYRNLRHDVAKYSSPQKIGPISSERIQNEFVTGFEKCIHPVDYLKTYWQLDLLEPVFPNFQIDMINVDRLRLIDKNLIVTLTYLLRGNKSNNLKDRLVSALKWPKEIAAEIGALCKALQAAKANDPREMINHCGSLDKTESRRENARLLGILLGDEVDQKIWNHFTSYVQKVYSGEWIMENFGIKTPCAEIGIKQRELQVQDYLTSHRSKV